MKKNISLITLFTLFICSPGFCLKVTFEDIDPKSFEDFKKLETAPKAIRVQQPPAAVTVPPKVENAKALPVKRLTDSTQPVQTVPAKTASSTSSSNNKTLIIGDSLSSSYGKFGPGITEELSKNGNEACLYSVSGSRFDQWTGNYFMKNPVGSSEIYFKDGKKISKDYKRNDPEPSNWNLEKLLSSHSCGNSQKKFTHLVVQLGSNHSKDYSPVKDLDKIFSLAKANGIQDIKFILPPDATKYNHQELRDKIKFYLSRENRVKSSYFDTVNRVAIQNRDLADGVHFYNTPSEKNWTTAVQSWLQDSNRQAVEEKIKESSHNRTVSN
jgi:hypothetical protein